MAERRMFTKKVTDDDNFMSLSSSAQALYLHLSMSADDDGSCNQVTLSMFEAHASVQDLQALLEKRYIYQFETGVIVIKHWRMANALRKDRYTQTAFKEELAKLKIKENGAYSLDDGCQVVADRLPSGCQVVADSAPQDREGKSREGKSRKKHGEYCHVLLSDEEYQKLSDEFGNVDELITFLDEYKEMKGYKCKNDYLAIRKWVVDAVKENSRKTNNHIVIPMPSTFLNDPDEMETKEDPEKRKEMIEKIKRMQEGMKGD